MNYDSVSLAGRAIALLSPVETPRGPRRSEHIAQGSPTRALMKACNQVLREGGGENVVWFMIAFGSAIAVGMSFLLL